MAKEFSRIDRISSQIQRELAQYIRQDVKDPRLGIVTVSAVEVTRDLAHAKVYVTTLDGMEKMVETLSILNGAAKHLRHLLGQNIKLRCLPQLHFLYDESVERGANLSALIDAAIKQDKKDQDEKE